jgi:ribonuclease HI
LKKLIAYTDGAVRGKNQCGNAAWAFVVFSVDEDNRKEHVYGQAGSLAMGTTNNVAEYTALVELLKSLMSRGERSIHVRSDSQLMVNQVNGNYTCYSEKLQPLLAEVNALVKKFFKFNIEWIPREQNSYADNMCNEVLNSVEMNDEA